LFAPQGVYGIAEIFRRFFAVPSPALSRPSSLKASRCTQNRFVWTRVSNQTRKVVFEKKIRVLLQYRGIYILYGIRPESRFCSFSRFLHYRASPFSYSWSVKSRLENRHSGIRRRSSFPVSRSLFLPFKVTLYNTASRSVSNPHVPSSVLNRISISSTRLETFEKTLFRVLPSA